MKTTALKLIAITLAVTGFAATVSAQTIFSVGTAQDLQNALTTAAANGAGTNIIYLANGYYTGNFNYNTASGDNSSLVITPALGLATTNITIDGAGLGRDLIITCGGSSGNVTINGITFLRNCGSYSIGALRIAAATGGSIAISGCQFIMNTNMEGIGVEIAAGQNTSITNCNIAGFSNAGGSYYNNGNGINISGITGNTVICNDTISGNYQGYGVDIGASSVLIVTNNVIQNNSNAGLYFNPSSGGIAQVQVIGNVFSGNGNGVVLYSLNTLALTGNTIVANPGVGAYVTSVTANIFENTFNGNTAEGAVVGTSFANVISNNFTGNYYAYGGDGLSLSGPTNTVAGNVFQGNFSTYGNNSGAGAYIYSYNLCVITNNTFSANQMAGGGNGGGGLYVQAAYVNTVQIVSNNSFIGNSGGYGGGLFVNSSSTNNLITANIFKQNSAVNGGGAIYVAAPTAVISDNLVANNSQAAANGDGGGLYLNPSSAAYVINNTIFGNTAGGGGGGIAFLTSGTQSLYVFNNIIWGNSAVGSGADVYLAGGGSQTELLYNDVNGLYGVWDIAENLLNIDPQFFNPVGQDFHFPETSPCANAGTNNVPFQPLTDLDGNNRTNNLGQIDLGCYQFNNTAPHPADTNGLFVVTAGEFNSYASAWKNGQGWTNMTSGPNPVPIPANYLTRAGYLMTNGGVYTNDGSARPTNWKP